MFAKTGSGQTQENSKKTATQNVFSQLLRL
eukprot:COSAG06_NODE_12409_length_1385_cov_2.157854_1_plen_29_part_10